ncbi:MAG: hypothetical protein HYU56_04260 [Candidatus Aenigmarchaeota archaeon]|nr:hypothetical protein [Candidatus Aenigmarchaeota archaeon]
MSKEVVASHHFMCGGIKANGSPVFVQPTIGQPVIVNVYTGGKTDVLCRYSIGEECHAEFTTDKGKCPYLR